METGLPAASVALRIGELLAERFRLQRVLAIDLLSGFYVATDRDRVDFHVRILHRSLLSHPQLATEFVKLCRAADGVTHPDAFRWVSEGVTDDGAPFVVSDPIEGETLANLVERRPGRIPPSEALRLVRDSLDLLVAIHAIPLIHGALRPGNILLTENGAVRLVEVGLGPLQELAAQVLNLPLPLEALAFTPPERAKNPSAPVDVASDLWCMSAILFSLLTGETVHRTDTRESHLQLLATQPSRPLAQVIPAAPASLNRLVQRGLSIDPSQRYPSAAAMRAAVNDAMLSPELASLRPLRSTTPPRGSWPVGMHQCPTAEMIPPLPPVHIAVGDYSASAPLRELGQPGVGTSAPPHPSSSPSQFPAQEPPTSYDAVVPASANPENFGPVVFGEQTERAATLPVLPGSDPPPPSSGQQSRSLLELLAQTLSDRLELGEWSWRPRLALEELRTRLNRLHTARGGAVPIEIEPWGLRLEGIGEWQADPKLLAIPHHLASAGIRQLLLNPGGDLQELETLLELLVQTVEKGVPPGEDLVTLLWTARLPRIGWRAAMELAPGDLERSARGEAERREILALGHFDTSEQLEDCWKVSRVESVARRSLVPPVTRLDRRELTSLARSVELEGDPDRGRIAFIFGNHPPGTPHRRAPETQLLAAGPLLTELLSAARDGGLDSASISRQSQSVMNTLIAAFRGDQTEVHLTFAQRAVWFAGRPLFAGRNEYGKAREIGEKLGGLGLAEFVFDSRITTDGLAGLVGILGRVLREGTPPPKQSLTFPGVVVANRLPMGPHPAFVTGDDALGLFAGSLVLLRRLFSMADPPRAELVRCTARVSLAILEYLEHSGALVATSALASAYRDEAGRALAGAILALAATRFLTRSHRTQLRIGCASLLGAWGAHQAQNQTVRQRALAAATACLPVPAAEAPALATAITAFEAIWLSQSNIGQSTTLAPGALASPTNPGSASEIGSLTPPMGPPYEGAFDPTVSARVVVFAHFLVRELATPDEPPRSLREALVMTGRPARRDPEMARLFWAALGDLPVGTVVELDSGEWAVVTEAGSREGPPRLRAITDTQGRALEPPKEVVLGGLGRRIARVVPFAEARFNVSRAVFHPN